MRISRYGLNSSKYALYRNIVPSIAAKKKPRHVVAWVRGQLGLTQSELANLVGASQHTIQAIELGKLPLSERFAYELAEQTGIRAKWFLANKLRKPLPDPAEMRKAYEHAQMGAWQGSLRAHFLPRMILLRIFVLLDEIATELSYGGCRATGFNDTLTKMTSKLLDCVPEKKLRRQIYQAARQVVSEGDRQVLSFWLARVQEMQRILAPTAQRKLRETASSLTHPHWTK